MPQSSYFRTPFESQRLQGYQTLLKQPLQHSYQKFPLIQHTFSCKTSLLVRYEILEMFGNMLTARHIYFRRLIKKISALCSTAITSTTQNIF